MAGDPLWYYKVLGLHCDGTNGSTTFTDVKGKTVTANGNAQISTAQYPALTGKTSSAYFDGSGDYLSVPDSANWAFGSGDFTIRCRVRFAGYPADNGGQYQMALVSQDLSTSRSFSLNVAGTASSITTLIFTGYSDNSTGYTAVSGSYAFSLNAWYLVEVCRVGNLVYLFVDGALLNAGGTAYTRAHQDSTTTLKIGAINYNATYLYHLNGYMSEVEIYKGVGAHSASYTQPTTPFPDEYISVSGTVKDSAGNFASRLVRVYRRDTGALVGASVSNPTTGAYKVIAANSGTTTPLKHSAVCFDPSVFAHYRVLGLHCDGTNGSTTVADVTGKSVTATNGAAISTAQYPSLTGKSSSLLLDGTNDYCSIPDSTDWDMGTGDFTIRFWCHPTSSGSDREIIAQRKSGETHFWFIRHTTAGKVRVYATTGTVVTDVTSTATLTNNVWQLVEIVRTSGSVKISIAGTFGTTVTTDDSGSWPSTSTSLLYIGIGDNTLAAGNFFAGYLSEIEIYKGVALHTTDFTPATVPFSSSTTATENALIYDDLTPT